MAERFYREVNQVDPYRPALLAYACPGIPEGANWTRWGEILAYDPYIYCGWGTFLHGTPDFVACMTIRLKRRADSVRKVVWIIPLASQMDPARTPRGVTAAEQNCQTYLALIHGAKGLLYFHGNSLYTQAAWDALSRLAQQMKLLGPAITGPPVPQEIKYQPTALDADKYIFPEIQAALFRHPDGRTILLAANGAAYPVTAVFTIPGLHEPAFGNGLSGEKAVKDLFGKETYPVREQAFSDMFEGYGVRAYVVGNCVSFQKTSNLEHRSPNIEGKTPETGRQTPDIRQERTVDSLQPPASIHLTVLSQPHPEKGTLDKTFPVAEIKKRRNVMPNPTFDIQTTPGEPDYIKPNMYADWPMVGAPGAGWGLDTNNPYHGRQCLRLVHRYKGGEPPNVNYRITMGVFYTPLLKVPTTYTFSFYARAARDGEKLAVHIHDMTPASPGGNFTLATSWQRYSFTGKLSAGPGKWPGGNRTFNFYTLSKDAVVWIDALQMEQGNTATAFTTD